MATVLAYPAKLKSSLRSKNNAWLGLFDDAREIELLCTRFTTIAEMFHCKNHTYLYDSYQNRQYPCNSSTLKCGSSASFLASRFGNVEELNLFSYYAVQWHLGLWYVLQGILISHVWSNCVTPLIGSREQHDMTFDRNNVCFQSKMLNNSSERCANPPYMRHCSMWCSHRVFPSRSFVSQESCSHATLVK